LPGKVWIRKGAVGAPPDTAYPFERHGLVFGFAGCKTVALLRQGWAILGQEGGPNVFGAFVGDDKFSAWPIISALEGGMFRRRGVYAGHEDKALDKNRHVRRAIARTRPTAIGAGAHAGYVYKTKKS
jgi:hypothetical protein